MITLIPDYHLCRAARSDRRRRAAGLHRLTPSRPLTMISGPSATSDIELNRVEACTVPHLGSDHRRSFDTLQMIEGRQPDASLLLARPRRP